MVIGNLITRRSIEYEKNIVLIVELFLTRLTSPAQARRPRLDQIPIQRRGRTIDRQRLAREEPMWSLHCILTVAPDTRASAPIVAL